MSKKIKWELFLDHSHYDMWAVRPVEDKNFNSPRLFHLVNKKDAEALKSLLEKSHCASPDGDINFKEIKLRRELLIGKLSEEIGIEKALKIAEEISNLELK